MDKCHFIGIGGIGMSSLAKILLSKKISVTGSDIAHSMMTDKLSKDGAKVYIGHQEQNVEPYTTVIYSSIISKDNPEYRSAVDKKCTMLHRSDLLNHLMKDYKTLAVTGTHGKTTTTALLSAVLIEAGLDPSFSVGGVMPQFETNGLLGKGEYFVAEADESDGTFLKYHPFGAIVTNIDLDHMDHFGSEKNLIKAFETFTSQVESADRLFWCGDDARLKALAPKGYRYGFAEGNDLRASGFRQNGWSSIFDIAFKGRTYEKVELALTGKHNVLNALAVFGMAIKLGIPEEIIRKAFRKFGGVSRRCENKGTASGVKVIDDYAHHPEEIRTTLKAIRNAIDEHRLIVLFQPHRYSRTQNCLGQYGDLFDQVDVLYVTDIYGAGEDPISGLSHTQIADEVKQRGKADVRLASRQQLLEEVCKELRPHDVVVTLGAGDITKLGPEIINHLKSKPAKKWKVGLFFGGRSAEHEIALRSVRYIKNHLRKEFYDIELFGITKEGKWLSAKESEEQLKSAVRLTGGTLLAKEHLDRLNECDIVFPVMHGPYGEDGTVQGMLEILGKPYVGCNHRAGAIGMNKVASKKICMLQGVATTPFVDFTDYKWRNEPEHIIDMICQQLHFPVFVKPVNLGSTIGITKVLKKEDLPEAIECALKFDHHVMVETGIVGREIEFAVYGNDKKQVLPPVEVLCTREIHDYESKYGVQACGYDYNPNLPQAVIEEGMFLAEKVYEALGCTGLARVDFFLEPTNRYLFGEINTMPGHTESSMVTKTLEAHQIPGEDMMDHLIRLGFQRNRIEQKHTVSL